MRESGRRVDSIRVLALAGFIVTLAGLAAAAQFPHARIWGINWWAYFPALVWPVMVAAAGLAVYLTAGGHSANHDEAASSRRHHLWLIGACALVLAVSFWLFRNRVYFLGDGYQLLGTLPSPQPYLKSRNFGGMMLPYLLMNLAGGPAREHALLGYQVVSVASGVIFVALGYALARELADRPVERFLIWLGLCTSGYTMLFFGYVENYALFAVAVLGFSYIGVLVDKKKVSRWWLWPAYLLTAFFHIFGLVLLPAALYQFMKSSPVDSPLKSPRVRQIIWAGGAVLGVASVSYLITTNLFFRLALVPIAPTRFTVAGYTLFSGRHLLDWVNLVMVLAPGILLFGVVFRQFWDMLRTDFAGIRFLTFASLTLLGLAFAIDPGLGMPRDWDLFACAGIPLATVLFVVMGASKRAHSRTIIPLAIILNLTLLTPRVAAMALPEKGLQVATEYIRLDPHKCLTYSYVVVEYVRDYMGVDSALALQRVTEPMFPDDREVDSGQVLTGQSRFPEAAVHFHRAIAHNPMNYSAWAALGSCFLETGQYDSALTVLTVAAGINPYSSVIAGNLAYAYYYEKNYDAAERSWLRSRKLDTTETQALVGLATLYGTLANNLKYAAYFDSIIARPDAPPEFLLTVVEYYVKLGNFGEAAAMIKKAVANGLDSATADTIVSAHPELKQYF